jgi:hypothetical protein
MANKIYTAVKNGETLKELKTLAAAKKLADAEGAEVFSDGECVYSPASNPVTPAISSTEGNTDVTEAEDVKEAMEPQPEKYTLLSLMNVRKAPSLKAGKAGTKAKGSVVEATLEDDWLHLTDGTFILYGGGRFARKE